MALLSNFDRWQLYCRDLSSPQSFVDFGFLYLIGAALQRRVWLGTSYSPIYPNPYIVLCGESGIGKGLVIKTVIEFLSYHKKLIAPPTNDHSPNGKSYKSAANIGSSLYKKEEEDELTLIPIAATSSTYEALVLAMAKSYDGINIPNSNEIYTYSSQCFALEELSSLFRKNMEDLINFLIVGWDCGDYKKDTKLSGTDRVKKMCLSLIAGTTPAFMQDTFDDKLVNEGFSSRSIYVCADTNRHNEMFQKELDSEQKLAKAELLYHIRTLTVLYGQCSYTAEAYGFLKEWWPAFCEGKILRANTNVKLNSYYARKKQHVQKVALAIHFAEQTSNMTIPLWCVKKAMDLLEDVEKKMHIALTFKANNPLAQAGRIMMAYLKQRGKATKAEIIIECWDYCKKDDTESMLESYISMGKVQGLKDEKDGKFYYTIIKG